MFEYLCVCGKYFLRHSQMLQNFKKISILKNFWRPFFSHWPTFRKFLRFFQNLFPYSLYFLTPFLFPLLPYSFQFVFLCLCFLLCFYKNSSLIIGGKKGFPHPNYCGAHARAAPRVYAYGIYVCKCMHVHIIVQACSFENTRWAKNGLRGNT